MRFIPVVILLMSACSAAAAAPAHHARPHHPVVVRPAEDAPVPPGWYKFPGWPPIPPSENRNLDPSNFGGG
ncbi:hypothetical protein ACVI1J_008872 [Bradyrhizobium diazoefficiens]|uniref:Uncharacterized protein n=1 Tax=Bradyrhizobium diazoefficiens TaxID=1355477 RepID=A0A809ZDE7_9BRAD|nr:MULTISPECIES: hypothetical protein [Bradyrhizobium]MDA9396443.1 hypothetical protein [Bradyrhizobium sp. CCBAU 45394]MDA9539664.1 hypothetical protein [Bradyrhizobium sp. CCBAU 21362]WLA69907.1 hypothetical protein QIH77_23610 [Bradyrhizobium diazoefficiens]BCE22525.1 hypothetical protein XF1B_52060 [Bradyrhizobium diazoefficiens]BCE48790.1 hypothetical protein XF4B_51390 [Bradyrhizobium diazoefficiens]